MGIPDEIQYFPPVLNQASFSYAILRPPATKVHKLREHFLKFTQTPLKVGFGILFPMTKERDHLIDSPSVGHH